MRRITNDKECLRCKQIKKWDDYRDLQVKTCISCEELDENLLAKGERKCEDCLEIKPITDFRQSKQKGKIYFTRKCKKCVDWNKYHLYDEPRNKNRSDEEKQKIRDYKRQWAREYREENLEQLMWSAAKQRAISQNVPFDIEVSDIIVPRFCPVLGIELKVSNDKNNSSSPSLDKTIPERGYVKGNIEVMSKRANLLKNNATIEEIEKLLDYMKKKSNNN